MKVAFLGLGTMGRPMAAHLVRAGHEVLAWNRSPGKEVDGARMVDLLEATTAELVAVCVNRSEDVQQVLQPVLEGVSPGTLIVDHSTIEPRVARDLHDDAARRGLLFLDAPITGGSVGAQNGTLTIFCGGTLEAYNLSKPVLQAYGKNVAHVGGAGTGQLTKLANQIAVAGALLGMAESLAFAHKAGLDVARTRELLASGAAGSWALEHYAPKILSKDWAPGFSVDNQRKDLEYVLAAAAELGAEVPGAALVDALLARLTSAGRGGDATAALFEVLG